MSYIPKLRFTFVNNDDFQIFAAVRIRLPKRTMNPSLLVTWKRYEKHLGLGANIGLGLYHYNIDAVVTGSCLLGERQSSYDFRRGLTMCDLDIRLIPRFWRFSLPSSVQVSERVLTEHSGVSYLTKNLVLSTQPGIDVIDNLRLYLNMEINHNLPGSRNRYDEFKIGGGTAFIWGE